MGGRKFALHAITLLMVAVTITATCICAFARPDHDEVSQLWRETTNLRRGHVMGFMDREVCEQSFEVFQGCINVLRWLAQNANQELVISENEIRIGDIQTKEEGAKLTGSQKIARANKKHAEDKANLEKWFSKPNKGGIAFAEITAQLFGMMASPEDEAVISAQAFNSFYEYVYDPHTYIQPLAYFEESKQSGGSEEYAGVGIMVHPRGEKIILEPFADSPAEKAGIRTGDVLTHVDGQPVSASGLEDMTKKIIGRIGSTVKLTIARQNQSRDVTIARAPVVLKNVSIKTVASVYGNIGVIQLRSFEQEKACSEVSQAIEALTKKNVKGLVLDLRNNGGGLMLGAGCIAGLFLEKGALVSSQKFLDPQMEEQGMLTGDEPQTKLPLTVLINARSASASELLAGALQDHHRAWIVGERSFGKGTAQSVAPFSPENFTGVVSCHTLSMFCQPSGRSNQIHGIIPDFEVAFKPGATAEERFSRREIDIYPHAIPNNEGANYVSPRKDEIAAISKIVEGQAEKRFDENAIDERRDLQLLRAIDVLGTEFKDCQALILK